MPRGKLTTPVSLLTQGKRRLRPPREAHLDVVKHDDIGRYGRRPRSVR